MKRIEDTESKPKVKRKKNPIANHLKSVLIFSNSFLHKFTLNYLHMYG